jgi:hypothetical protein
MIVFSGESLPLSAVTGTEGDATFLVYRDVAWVPRTASTCGLSWATTRAQASKRWLEIGGAA